MEAWQKKLNEVLRVGNGFANAGAIPKRVKRKGKAAIQAHMAKRAAEKPSSAQWVFEQGMLQQHAYMTDVLAAADDLRKKDRTVSWDDFNTYWRRYMVCAAMRCRLLARARRGATRGFAELPARTQAKVRKPEGYAAKLLKEYHAYWADVGPLSATDLDEQEARRQRRELRRERYRATQIAS
jgi:hypothetical protein